MTFSYIIYNFSSYSPSNPELHFKQALDLDGILAEAFAMYCKDNNIKQPQTSPDQKPIDMKPFYSLPYSETTGYLARAAVNKVLQGGVFSTAEDDVQLDGDHLHDDNCKVS